MVRRFALVPAALLLIGWVDASIEVPLVIAEGGEAELVAIVPDGSELAWELDEDGLFDDGDQLRPIFDARGIDGPYEAVVGLEVVSEGEVAYRVARIQIANVAPTILSEPPAVARRGFRYEYKVEIADPGVEDTQAMFAIADDVAPEGMLITGDGRIEWTPGGDDLGVHLIRVLVSDRDGGVAAQNWLLEVLDNDAPFAPNPLEPEYGCYLSREPVLRVGNTNDPDSDPLTYFFEVAENTDFEGTTVVASPPVPEAAGPFTSWTVSRALDPGGVYYWRAWTTDGALRSVMTEGWLCVREDVTDDDGPEAVQPPNLPEPTGRDVRYGCSTMPGLAASPILFALAALVRRRRSR